MSQSSLRSVSHIDAVEQNGLWIARGYESLLEAHGIDSLEALAAYGGGERLDKLGLAEWRERWRITLGSGDVGPTLYLKRYTSPPPAARREARRAGCGARSLAAVEWRWMHRLRRDGIACVEPVAFGEECRGRREVRSLILTAAVPGVSLETLAAHRTDAHPSATARFCLKTPSPRQGEGWGEGRISMNHASPDLSPQGERDSQPQPGVAPCPSVERHKKPIAGSVPRPSGSGPFPAPDAPASAGAASRNDQTILSHDFSLSDELASLIGRFHALGYVHRDLYLSHVFFDATAPPPHRLRLIDLQRVLRPVWRKRRWIVKDLAALNYSTPTTMASRTDRLRWLRSYLRVAGQVVLRTPGNDRSMHRSHEGDSRGIRWTGERRALVYRILGKTFQIARHDQSRQRRVR